MKKSAINGGELSSLCTSLAAFRIFTTLPLIFTWTSGTGAPLSALLSGILAIAFILFRYKGESIFSRTKSSFVKYVISISALVYLSASALFTLTEFSYFAKLTAFPTTPLWFISLFFITAAGLGALGGISALQRSCRYMIPVFAAVVCLVILSVLWKADLTNLFPILGNGTTHTLSRGLSGILLYSDISLIFLIDQPPGCQSKAKRSAMWGTVFGVLLCFFTVVAYTAKIPYPISKDEQFPFYLLMKEVYYGRFFQRIDAVIQFISALWGMLSLCLNLCLITKILENTFEVTSKPAVIFPLSAALFFLSTSGADNHFTILLYTAAVFAAVVIVASLFKKEAVQNEN